MRVREIMSNTKIIISACTVGPYTIIITINDNKIESINPNLYIIVAIMNANTKTILSRY